MSKTEKIEYVLPEGRLINHSLFVKDKYNDKAPSSYKVELAFAGKDTLDKLYDLMIDAAKAEWGEIDEDELIIPIKDGDKMAAKREKNDKPGDAYVGMEVVRAKTLFNKHGENDAGGIQVIDEDLVDIEAVDKDKIYRGVYGRAKVSIDTYIKEADDTHDEDRQAITLYLMAFQRTKDGDRLGGTADHAGSFDKVGREEGEGTSNRRSRKG